MSKYYDPEINYDDVEEVREIIKYAIENKKWLEVEEALELLNGILGHDDDVDDDEDSNTKRNTFEE